MTGKIKISAAVAVAIGALAAIGLASLPTAYAEEGNVLVMGPTGFSTPDSNYLAAAEQLYLEPLGFTGHEIALTTPETYAFGPSVDLGVLNLVGAVTLQYDLGQIGPNDPLVVFGFSQSAVLASMAMPYLYAEGIPSDDLRFVLVGDTASAQGGFLSTFLDSLPPQDQLLGAAVMNLLWMGNLAGATTPDNLYPVDVFTIQNDGWADWPSNILASPTADLVAMIGMAINHLEYLGLAPAEIGSATYLADGLAQYFTIAQPQDWLDTLLAAAANMFG